METEFASLWTEARAVWAAILVQAQVMLLPSRLTQIGVLVALAAASWLVSRWIGPPLYERMRALEGRPKWQLRTLVVLHRRRWLILFVVLAWITAGVIANLYVFPSRRYLIELVATLATAILLVGLAGRLVRNATLRQFVTWGLWIYVTLYYVGLIRPATSFLDSVAVQFGEFRLSIYGVLKALVVTGILITVARLVSGAVAARIRASEDISPTMQVLSVKMLQVLLFGAAFFIGLKAVGFDLTGLAVLSGAIGVGIGFGLQKVVSNLVSGIIILLDKSIKPGDVISLGETFGWVVELGARYVSITTRDGKEYLIPNEDLITGQVVNWTHSDDYVRLDIHFGTSYADDPHLVRRVAIEACAGVRRVLPFKQPVCHITGFGDSSVDYILRFWIRDPTEGLTNIRGNVFLALWDAFKAHGISIPFPQREVRVLAGSEGARPVEPEAGTAD